MFHFVLGALVGLPVGFGLSTFFPGVILKIRKAVFIDASKLEEGMKKVV